MPVTSTVEKAIPAVSTSDTSLVAAMSNPEFYPHRPSEVEHRETHISHLFFAGDLVYKIKKNVRYSFVDYSTLTRRQFFLQEELRLNRRLAPSVYLGILPISHDDYGWQLGGDFDPAEYVLVMRRLPEKRMLDYLLERGQVTPKMMAALAEILASFHSESASDDRIRGYGHPSRIRKVWEQNLADLAPFVGRAIDQASYAAIRAFGERFLQDHGELMLRRAAEGRTREVHGDLHCEHICFAPEGIQIFDCVEFSSQFRCCDVASELGFLLMDLEARGAKRHAEEFLAHYLELGKDLEITKLLPFYQCYRALVRGKVFTLLADGQADAASRYFDLAYSTTWLGLKPFAVIVCGLTGSGKSTLARALSRRLGVPAINSDFTRKILAGKLGHERVSYGEGIYSASMTNRAYHKMTDEAERQLAAREGVVLDATFQKGAQRSAVFEAAERSGAAVAVVHCHAPEALTEQRLRKRSEEAGDLSDGSWEVYLKQKALFEPLGDAGGHPVLTLDTSAPTPELCGRVEEFLREKFSARSHGADPYRVQQSNTHLLSASR